jgi:hypothetical protein
VSAGSGVLRRVVLRCECFVMRTQPVYRISDGCLRVAERQVFDALPPNSEDVREVKVRPTIADAPPEYK